MPRLPEDAPITPLSPCWPAVPRWTLASVGQERHTYSPVANANRFGALIVVIIVIVIAIVVLIIMAIVIVARAAIRG